MSKIAGCRSQVDGCSGCNIRANRRIECGSCHSERAGNYPARAQIGRDHIGAIAVNAAPPTLAEGHPSSGSSFNREGVSPAGVVVRKPALHGGGHNDVAIAGERAYFARYPKRDEIRRMACRGEPYWFIAQQIGCCVATVSNAIRHMLAWGILESRLLEVGRMGMHSYWAWLRKNRFQRSLEF